MTPEPDNKTIEDLAKRYTNSNAALEAFSQGFRDKYQRLCVETLKKYQTKPFKERIKDLIQGWKTWDNYSLSILYLKFIYFLTRSKDSKTMDNSFVRFMTQLLVTNIHPDFKRRYTVKETVKRFDQFLGSSDKNDLDAIEEVISHVEKNKKDIDRSIIINSRRIKSLTEKTVIRKI